MIKKMANENHSLIYKKYVSRYQATQSFADYELSIAAQSICHKPGSVSRTS